MCSLSLSLCPPVILLDRSCSWSLIGEYASRAMRQLADSNMFMCERSRPAQRHAPRSRKSTKKTLNCGSPPPRFHYF